MRALLIIFSLLVSVQAYSTPEYSVKTGKDCAECHGNSDGSELTAYGEEYLESISREDSYEPKSKTDKIIRSVFGFIHFLTAFIWFGAILYIHLVLKPKYVAQGIPKRELKIGWVSMLIMLGTGIYLTFQKFPDPASLFQTSVGILLLIKIGLFLFMMATIFIVTFYIAPKLNKQSKISSEKTEGDFTPDELSYFDGKEGRPAYIAYKGIVYDVTHNVFWPEGLHLMKHYAGMDLTSSMSMAPHGAETLESIIQRGNLVEEKSSKRKPVVRFFYFLAYSVLVAVFLIIFILSAWRWWF